jgi:hypothetical protein
MAFTSRFPVRKATIVLAFALVAILISSGAALAKTYWFENYQRAVNLIDAGRSAEALPILEKLLVDQPVPTNAVRVPGNRFVDYLPYYQIARAQAQLGNLELAEHSLVTSESYGVVTETHRHTADLAALKSAIANPVDGVYLTTRERD